jgi:hypothetical protein
MQGTPGTERCAKRPFVTTPKPQQHQNSSRRVLARIKIDRKRHMEIAWKRQQQADLEVQAELQAGPNVGRVWEVRSKTSPGSSMTSFNDVHVLVRLLECLS